MVCTLLTKTSYLMKSDPWAQKYYSPQTNPSGRGSECFYYNTIDYTFLSPASKCQLSRVAHVTKMLFQILPAKDNLKTQSIFMLLLSNLGVCIISSATIYELRHITLSTMPCTQYIYKCLLNLIDFIFYEIIGH